jgi:hypothetical protein
MLWQEKEDKMNSKGFLRKIAGGALGLVMMAGITIATAQAQERNYDYHGRSGDQGTWSRERNDGRWDIYAIARQNGYRDGNRHGEEDRVLRRGFNYQHSSQYRIGLGGYRWGFGNRDRYRDAYREGYRRGYAEGFRRGYNNRGRWPS